MFESVVKMVSVSFLVCTKVSIVTEFLMYTKHYCHCCMEVELMSTIEILKTLHAQAKFGNLGAPLLLHGVF